MLAALCLLPLLAFASPLEKRDGPAIQRSIGYISSNITRVNNTLNTFTSNGDSVTALTIQGQTNDLISSVNNAASTAGASAPLSDSESGNVAFAVLNLEPQIFSLLDNIDRHEPQFSTAIFGFSANGLVVSDLQQSRNASLVFGRNLVAKLTAAYQGAAPTIINQIDARFNQSIGTFSS